MDSRRLNVVQLLFIIVVSVQSSDDATCAFSEIVHGVPDDLNLKEKASSSVISGPSFEECVNKCCENDWCQAAGVHKEFCILAACYHSPCVTNSSVDPEDPDAQFVFINRIAKSDEENSNTPAGEVSETDATTEKPEVDKQAEDSVAGATEEPDVEKETDQETADSSQDTDSSNGTSSDIKEKSIEPSESEANATVAVDNTSSDNSAESEEEGTSAPSSSSTDQPESEEILIESPEAGTSQENKTESTISENEAENQKVEKTTVGPAPAIRDETIPKKNSKSVTESNTTKDAENDNKEADTIKDKPDNSKDADTTKEETAKPDSGKVTLVCDPVCPENTECFKKDNGTECVCKDGFVKGSEGCLAEVTCAAASCNSQEHTTCTVVANKITCPCQSGYKLEEEVCIEVTCVNVTCPVHASCSLSENQPHCFCNKAFVAQGAFCRSDIACVVDAKASGCPTNEFCKQTNDKPQCMCNPGKLRAAETGDCTDSASAITLACEDALVQLPAESASLTVVVTPPHNAKSAYYSYTWEMKGGPEKGDSVVEGLTKPTVMISKLTVGEYTFLVTVIGTKNEYQTKNVKLTVVAEAHKNGPPTAVIKPAGVQSFKLPADFSLNGIDSTDDVKIVSYAWTIEGMPSKNHVALTGEGTDTLNVKVDEGEGEFEFKLVVKDKEGLFASAVKSVQILAEDDFPPSAKVSAPLTLTLPKNSAVLSGDESKDDHEITRWEWAKSADSPATGDMTGTTKNELALANLVEGTYTFTLTVYDKKEQSSHASTTVTVRPAEEGPPVASAGDNKELVMPARSTQLDGSGSTSRSGDLKFLWTILSGPPGMVLAGTNSSMLTLTGLSVGVYTIKLTVIDSKNVSSSDEVTVTVKEDNNKPPVARLGSSKKLYEPDTAVDLDGSNSTDDNGIVRYEWTRSPNSPALGQVVSRSQSEPVLKLCDLIVGVYTFTLTVYDEKGESSSASTTVSVEPNPHSRDIVEVYLFEDPVSFTQERLDSLLSILMVSFSKSKERAVSGWDLVTLSVKKVNRQIVVYLYGKDESGGILPGPPLVKQLRQRVYGQILGFDFDVIDTSTCSNQCSAHGTCDNETRTCKCHKFWMENFFKAAAGRQFSNCEWSKIYFGLVIVLMSLGCMVVVYVVWYIFSLRNDQIRRRRRYKKLEDETSRGVSLNDSSDDSDFFKMKLKTPKTRPKNGGFALPKANTIPSAPGFKPANVLKKNAGPATDKRK